MLLLFREGDVKLAGTSDTARCAFSFATGTNKKRKLTISEYIDSGSEG